MRRLILILLLGFVGCTSTKTETTQVLNTTPQNNASSKTGPETAPIDCRDPDSYQVVEVREPKQAVNIVSGDKVLRSLDMPSDSEFGNFGLGSTKKIKGGAEIEVDWGTRYYYNLRFIFACKNNDLILTNIAVESFDKGNPSKWTKKNIAVKPPVPIGRFNIADYLKKSASL